MQEGLVAAERSTGARGSDTASDTGERRRLDPRPLRDRFRDPALVTALFAVVSGFLLSAALATGRDAAQVQQSRHDELVALVEERHEHVEVLSARLEELRAEVGGLEERAGPAGALAGDVAAAEEAAGLTPLAGPGVRLRLDDGTGECPSGDEADCRIRDRDLQAAVNMLFGAGAEAVAVNGERIVATTAIRNAGSAVLVNYRVLGAPYEVEAIGDGDTLVQRVEASDLAADFAAWVDHYGLGFEVDTADELRLPSYSGRLRSRAADARDGDETSIEVPERSGAPVDPDEHLDAESLLELEGPR